MTLTINIHPETERGLLAKAQAKGISHVGFVEEIVAREVRSGDAPNGANAKNLVEQIEEALNRLLQTQEEQDRWLMDDREVINAKIRRGIEQLDRGDGIPGDEAWERLQKRKEVWLKRNPATKP